MDLTADRTTLLSAAAAARAAAPAATAALHMDVQLISEVDAETEQAHLVAGTDAKPMAAPGGSGGGKTVYMIRHAESENNVRACVCV